MIIEITRLQTMNESKNQAMNETITVAVRDPKLSRCLPGLSSPRPLSEPDAAAAKLQRIYKTLCGSRRNLADCAVVVEELWSVSTSATFCFRRICVCVLPVQEMSLMSLGWWQVEGIRFCVSEALLCIDPRHRYGHNLQYYYDVWFESESSQPFLFWLDVGDGREINLDKCPRSNLHDQCIRYLGPKEREAYEVIVDDGRLVYRESGLPVSTVEGSKWIFVISTSRVLYVGQQKRKGNFQHSSFLAGGAATAAGRLVVAGGVLKAIWPYSGHYLPTEENFEEFIVFLRDNNVDLSNVKRCSVDDDTYPSFRKNTEEMEDVATVPDAAQEATGWDFDMKGRVNMESDGGTQILDALTDNTSIDRRFCSFNYFFR
ncbi:unnamed protein product [Musa banksii]